MSVARQQMAVEGASALSLRAIAREMGMTAPALYRYFRSRDDLVTALIVSAFGSLAGALENAREAMPADDHPGRVLAIVMAYREWALTHPQDYLLIFGTPISGYVAPADITVPVAKRSMDVVVDALMAAWKAGDFEPAPEYARSSAALEAQLTAWKENYGYTAKTPAMHLALAGWGLMHGLVSLELVHQLQPFFGDATEIFRAQMLSLLKRAGLKIDERVR